MDHFNLFSTPVFVFALDGVTQLNQRLVDSIGDEARNTPGTPEKSPSTWRSTADLAQRGDTCYRVLMEVFASHISRVFQDIASAQGVTPQHGYQCSLQAWATVMSTGDYTAPHSHDDAHWSAVYHADAGDADALAYPQSGALGLLDPRRGSASIAGLDVFPATFTVPPRTGSLIVFPGWLTRHVHPYRGARQCVSVWCSARVEPTRA